MTMPSWLYKRTGMLDKRDSPLSSKPLLFISSKMSPEIDARRVGLLEGDGEGKEVGCDDGVVVMLGDSLGASVGMVEMEGDNVG